MNNTIARFIIPSAIIAFSAFNASAQKSLDDVLKKLEANKDVETVYSERRDPQTRQLTGYSYLLSSSDMSLTGPIIEAFRRERENSVNYAQMSDEMYSITFNDDSSVISFTLIIDKKDWMLTSTRNPARK